MLRSLFFISLLASAVLSNAQNHWATRVGAWSNEAFNDVAIDAQGYLYAVGEFGGNIELNATNTLISQGGLDVLVAKYDPNGDLVWARTFGASGLDRAIKVALTADGYLAVVGQFMLAVDFDVSTLISQASTQDMFMMKLAQSDGAVSWVRQGGSPDGVDQPNGVSVGPDGSIAVAGEFRGNAVFDQGTLTSIIDPDNGQPSVDIFLATYASDGTPLWIQQGAAEFADRGMDVVHDLDGNLYLTGQFSDTITFDQTHNNAMYSAIFIVRFSPTGVEEWFRAFGGGTYNQVFEMLLVEGDRLMLVGDVQGTVIFLDSSPDLWTVTQPRSSFLLEVDLDGELLRQKNWGSQYTVNTRSLSVLGDDILVLGRFTCQFTGFSAIYGDGTFIATGPNDLYVARFQLTNFVFKEAQQFGGQGDKVPGGIVHAADASPIFSGSFEHLLVFPSTGVFNAWPSSALLIPSVLVPYCADYTYDGYTDLRGSALKDAFLARGYEDSREPYDIFHRSGINCDRSLIDPVIRAGNDGVLGPDSLARCSYAVLLAQTFTSYSPDTAQRHTAPDFTFLWNNGSTTASVNINQTGWYWVTVSFGPGCIQRTDSIHITINQPPPQLLFNDDVVVNSNAHPPQPIEVCEPDQPWLWITGQPPENTVLWTGPIPPTVNDSVLATASGIYYATVTTPLGCVRYNALSVIIYPSGPLPPYDVELIMEFPQDEDLNDTIEVCLNDVVLCDVTANIMLNGQPTTVPDWVEMYYACGSGWTLTPLPGFSCSQLVEEEGWYDFTAQFLLTNAPCGIDSLFFSDTASVYVIPLAVSAPLLSLTGPALMCPGDTVAIVGLCIDCATTAWQGTPAAYYSGDTAWVIEPGDYLFIGNAVDTNSCITSTTVQHTIDWNPVPLLAVDPVDGIICPNATATIWSESQGLSYQWYGPLGPMSVANDTIITSQQGFYYLDMVDSLGCLVSSDPILVTDYATPYLNVLPDNVLCEPGETAILQVITTSTATLQWLAPFAGSNAVQQTVTQPGIYTCNVTACGIVTELSVEIYGNTANAELVVPGPFSICPGTGITLEAIPGMAVYYWYPGPLFAQQITTDTAGTYLLVVTSNAGCQDSLFTTVTVIPTDTFDLGNDTLICPGATVLLSAPSGFTLPVWFNGSTGQQLEVDGAGEVWLTVIATNGCTVSDTLTVTEHTFPILLTAQDVLLCSGSNAVLVANGSGTITWYADPALTQVLATGSTYTVVAPPVGITTLYLTQSDAVCTSATVQVNVVVGSAPLLVSINGPENACPGDAVTFTLVSTTPNVIGAWETPQGTFTGTTVAIDPVLEADQGVYTVVPANGPCLGDPLSITLDVFNTVPPQLGPDTAFCAGALLQLAVPTGYTDPIWSTGSNSFVITVDLAGSYSLLVMDQYGCAVSDTILIATIDCDDIIPNVVTPNGDGHNDVWLLGPGGYTAALLDVYNRWGQLVWSGDVIHLGFRGNHMHNGEPLSEGTYFYVLHLTRGSGNIDDLKGHITLLR